MEAVVEDDAKELLCLLKVYYKVTCFYITKQCDHFHTFGIGIYDSKDKAERAVKTLKLKPGFCDHQDRLKIKKRLRISPPKLLNKTFWEDGFVAYTY